MGDIVKAVLTAAGVLAIFLFGVHFAFKHPSVSKQVMTEVFHCDYSSINKHK